MRGEERETRFRCSPERNPDMIKVENLVKHYGNKRALDGVSFEIGDGEIVGLLGPNGAGKSTVMNIMTGYLSATDGTVNICGYDILENAFEAKKLIGYLPEVPPLYPDMTVLEYLGFVYELRDCAYNRKKHLAEICEVVKISDVRNRLISSLSKGYRQRVGIASALVGNPKIIILDEPTVGLDPRQIIEIRNLIRTLGRNHSVLLSTHLLGEAQAVCDRVIIMNKGKVLADERTADISDIGGGNRRTSVIICGPRDGVTSELRALPGVKSVSVMAKGDDSTTYLVESEAAIDIRKPMFYMLAQKGWPLIGSEALGASLEDIFVSMTGQRENARGRTGKNGRRDGR